MQSLSATNEAQILRQLEEEVTRTRQIAMDRPNDNAAYVSHLAALRHLRSFRLDTTGLECPRCDGEGCSTCHGDGRVLREEYLHAESKLRDDIRRAS